MNLFRDLFMKKPTGVEHINQKEAKRIMDEEKGYVILDVRTPKEFSTGHIKGAICVPNETIDEKILMKLKDKDQKILVYCQSGGRSRQAAAKLSGLGYSAVKDFGGVMTWPYGLVK